MSAFTQLFIANLKLIYRNKQGFFWTAVMPVGIYVALSILPVGRLVGQESYANFLLPGIIALTIMQGGVYSLTYWTVDLKGRGVIKRLQVTPLNKYKLIFSLISSRSIVMLVQVLFLTLIGTIFFHTQLPSNPLIVILLTIIGAFIFLPLGLLIASFTSSYEAAAPITAAVALPLNFLGNVFYPISLLPDFLQQIGHVLPITYLASAFRLVYLNNGTNGELTKDILILLLWSAIVLSLALWRFKFEE